MGIGGPDCEVHFSTGFLRLSPLLQLAVITHIFLRHITGGEGVVGSNPAAPTIHFIHILQECLARMACRNVL